MIKNMPKSKIELGKEIDRIREKYGKTPLGKEKSYEERLKEYEDRKTRKK